MTEPEHLRESLPLDTVRSADAPHGTAPAARHDTAQFDTTAQLLTRITAQLGTQLSHVRLNGNRSACPRPTIGRPSSP
ncbi:hypothetical protein [Streptomyces sp. NPDC018833]|uniref:hypothetical protein n=1 Tax=Streptomyces sp. NPDC018833 TaxID=3365053 RepID=UPI0037A6939F